MCHTAPACIMWDSYVCPCVYYERMQVMSHQLLLYLSAHVSTFAPTASIITYIMLYAIFSCSDADPSTPVCIY